MEEATVMVEPVGAVTVCVPDGTIRLAEGSPFPGAGGGDAGMLGLVFGSDAGNIPGCATGIGE